MKNKVINLMKEYRSRELVDYEEHCFIRETLKDMEGKKLTRAIIRKFPDGWKFSYDDFGRVRLTSPEQRKTSNGGAYSRMHRITKVGAIFSLEDLDDANIAMVAAKERADKIQQMILSDDEEIDKLIKVIKAFKKAKDAIDDLNVGSSSNPAKYFIMESFGLNTNLILEITHL